MRQRARIVLLAANGMASRTIGRAVGCTTGTVSKWRAAMPRSGLAGLDETGDRGAEPKYTAETCRIKCRPRVMPAERGHCWLLRWAMSMSMSNISGASCVRRRSTLPGANPSARATIPSSSPRLPTWSGYIWRRPRTPSSSASTKSPRSRRWVFDDPRVGLNQEPFVSGADAMIDRVVADVPNADSGFTLVFSSTPFPGHQYQLSVT